jgi:hypothetical protein
LANAKSGMTPSLNFREATVRSPAPLLTQLEIMNAVSTERADRTSQQSYYVVGLAVHCENYFFEVMSERNITCAMQSKATLVKTIRAMALADGSKCFSFSC